MIKIDQTSPLINLQRSRGKQIRWSDAQIKNIKKLMENYVPNTFKIWRTLEIIRKASKKFKEKTEELFVLLEESSLEYELEVEKASDVEEI
uniref:Uncharacterized protein n=1 Tax=Lepeophtheirus salmonis TaxID=72036 RepID=A0A0K2UI61_LEPSM